MALPTSSLLTGSGGQQMELSMSDAVNFDSNSAASNGTATPGTPQSRGQKQKPRRSPNLSFPRSSRDSAELQKKKTPTRAISFGQGVTVPDGEAYQTLQKEKGPKLRKNRKKHGCLWGLSKSSWLFLLLALGQGGLICRTLFYYREICIMRPPG